MRDMALLKWLSDGILGERWKSKQSGIQMRNWGEVEIRKERKYGLLKQNKVAQALGRT
jgi:hypothetical protein